MTRERLVEGKVDRNSHQQKDDDQRSAYTGHLQMIPNITMDGGGSDDDEGWYSVSSSTSLLNETDIMAYRACSHGAISRLIIYSGGVRFVRSVMRKELWRHSFLELTEMAKHEGSLVSRLPKVSSQSLDLTHRWSQIDHQRHEGPRFGV